MSIDGEEKKYQGVVKKKKSGMMANSPCRNMILTNQPRLYFTSTLDSDGTEDVYKGDILLYDKVQVIRKSKTEF